MGMICNPMDTTKRRFAGGPLRYGSSLLLLLLCLLPSAPRTSSRSRWSSSFSLRMRLFHSIAAESKLKLELQRLRELVLLLPSAPGRNSAL